MSRKFNQVIHPEIVLDLRGDEANRKTFRAFHPPIGYDAEKGYNVDNVYRQDIPPLLLSYFDSTPSFREIVLITWKFKQENPPIYQVGRDFLKAMAKIDSTIPVDLLPEKFFAYFSFPQGSVMDFDGDAVMGIYLYIGAPNETCLNPKQWATTKRAFWAVYVTEKFEVSRILMDLDKPGTFGDLVKNLPLDPGVERVENHVFRMAINLALYVSSVDPKLQLAPPQKELKPAEKKARQGKGETINQCLLPVTFVSWDYHHPERVYLKDGTFVDTFQRWQRCGKNNSQVRLIWVREHPRKFKNVKGQSE